MLLMDLLQVENKVGGVHNSTDTKARVGDV